MQMTLTTCKECQSKISTSASKCPHCGIRLKANILLMLPLCLITFIGAYVAIQAFMGHSIATKTSPQIATQSEPKPLLQENSAKGFELSYHANYLLSSLLNGEIEEIAVGKKGVADQLIFDVRTNASELAKIYEDNEIAGDQKFRGMLIRISGKITSIGSDFQNKPFVTFEIENEFRSPIAKLKENEINRITKLKKGQTINLVCVGAGEITSTPILQECDFLDTYVREHDPHLLETIKSYLGGKTIDAKAVPIVEDMVAIILKYELILSSDSECYKSTLSDEMMKCITQQVDKFTNKNYTASSLPIEFRKKAAELNSKLKAANLDNIAKKFEIPTKQTNETIEK